MTSADAFVLKELVLHQLQFGSMVELPAGMRQHAQVDVTEDYLTHSLVARLTTFVLADQLAPVSKSFSYETFASWWQHTKAVHFPTLSRWVRRAPRMKRHVVEVEVRNWAVFPESTIAYPKELGPVRIHQSAQMALDWAAEDADPTWREEWT